MNEEDIKGRLVLPFLNDLGINPSDISLERSFTIRLGRSKYATGRSDILCKSNGKNLFVIELKNDSVSISQDDINQGISYARALLDNIAPFTIITNGITTKIFDSISKIDLTGKKLSEVSSYEKSGYAISPDEELRLRYEALKNFVAFSQENLRLFCKNQVQDRMGPIIGSIDNPYSKFVKELYVQRQDLLTAFNNFINSKASFFGIVGSAGVGKTSTMCSLAIESLEDNFVFFYNAAIINKSPLEHIAQDLNGVFSSKSDAELVLKKLDELGRFLNKNVLIFIDAIDESFSTNISLELSEIALASRNLDKIKICISCKSNIWKNLLKVSGTYTHLFEELNKFHDLIGSLDNSPGFLLKEFSDEELKNIIPLYKSSFGFSGEISEELHNELRNGFFLRIFSEVYSNREIPKEIDDKDLIKRYINQSLEKTKLGLEAGLRILSKIGKILIKHKYSSWDFFNNEGLEVDNLLEKLNFTVNETIPEDLFARNILIKSNKEDSYNVTFYYSKIRDYIICFHSYKLDQLNDNEFYEILNDFYENYIGQSAVNFYIENAIQSHKNALIKFKNDKALKYVMSYNSYLEGNFKNFKILFDPKTEGDIGILLPRDLLTEDGYALFPLDSSSSNIIQYENLGVFSEPYENSVFFKKRVHTIHGSNTELLVQDQSQVTKTNIFKQLKEILKKGELNSYNSDILLLEEVSTILYYYSSKLDYDFKIKDFYLPRFELIYPIDLKDLRDRIYRFIAYHHFERNRVPSKLIDQMVEEAVKNNTTIPKLNIYGDFPPFEELFKIVNILLEKGYKIIETHHLPYPDKSVIETKILCDQNSKLDLHQIRSAQYSEDQARRYIESFFQHLESCYREFVEYWSPSFKNELPFFTTLPHEYFFYLKELDNRIWGYLGERPSKNKKMVVYYKEYSESLLQKAFEDDNITVMRGFSLDSILHNDYNNIIKTIGRINTPKVDDFCVIRNWIYRLLKNDMEKLFKENKVTY